MKILETLLLGVIVTSIDLGFEAWSHKQPMSLSTSFSIGQDKNSARTAPSSQTKIGYLGITLTKNVIGEVFADSPADKAGITSGDKIMEVNDKSIFGLNGCGIADELIGPDGTAIELIVEHSDELRKLKIIRAQAVPAEAERVVSEAKQSALVENWTR
jgi:C-terminal processing protease CtpA/Prc